VLYVVKQSGNRLETIHSILEWPIESDRQHVDDLYLVQSILQTLLILNDCAHPQDTLVVNVYTLHNPHTPFKAIEARSNFYSSMFQRRGSISIPRGSLSGEVQYLFSGVSIWTVFWTSTQIHYCLDGFRRESKYKCLQTDDYGGFRCKPKYLQS
jgi:hypothetical protein